MSVVRSPTYSVIAPPSISCHPWSLILKDDHLEGSLIEMDRASRQKQNIINNPLRRTSPLLHRATTANRCNIGQLTLDILPDEVLLVIFDHYVTKGDEDGKFAEWHTLVHVCQKWRYIVFWSPLRLNLRILCSAGTSVKEKLAPWPPLPIIIEQYDPSTSKCGEDNIIEALGHNDRVCKIALAISGSLFERVFAATQTTFVGLKDLYLDAIDDWAPDVPDSFLGGSAPHLRYWSTSIPFPFPILRKLLLSAPNLAILSLRDIPYFAYFSPEALVTCLSAFTRLEALCIEFKSPRSRPPLEGRRRRPRPTRSILPALTVLRFVGVSEYLEDLVTRIDAPQLNELDITFFYQLIFNTPQLVQLISRTPNLKAYDEARVIFSDSRAAIALPGRDNPGLKLGISCSRSDWQLSSLAQLCTSSFPQALISMVEHLHILEDVSMRPHWQDDLETDQWLELFHPFRAVKNLYLSREFAPRIAPALQELVGERVTEVLPNLQSIFFEDLQEPESVPEAMQQFIAARQLSDRPIAISHWTRQNRWSTISY